jgi:amino acid permease
MTDIILIAALVINIVTMLIVFNEPSKDSRMLAKNMREIVYSSPFITAVAKEVAEIMKKGKKNG